MSLPRRTRAWILLAVGALGVVGIAVLFPPWASPARPLPSLRPGSLRIYVLGGSTAAGIPYRNACDPARLVAWLLEGRLAGLELQPITLAGAGADSRDVLEQVDALLHAERAAGAEPRAVVFLYCGNNELLGEEEPGDIAAVRAARRLFDVRPYSQEREREVLARYAQNLETATRRLQAAGVPVVLSTVAVNLRDWPPNRSVLADAAHESALAELFRAASESAALGARTALERALALEPRFAWSHFRLGQVLEELGLRTEARAAYQAAVDCDAYGTRATTRHNDMVRAVARRSGAALVDAQELANTLGGGLPGRDVFLDSCHPRLALQLEIAKDVAVQTARALGTEVERSEASTDELAQHFAIGPEARLEFLERATRLALSCSFYTWERELTLGAAREHLEAALALDPHAPEATALFAVLHVLRGEVEASRPYWRRAHELDGATVDELLANKALQSILAQAGWDDARVLLAAEGAESTPQNWK